VNSASVLFVFYIYTLLYIPNSLYQLAFVLNAAQLCASLCCSIQ